MKPIGIITGIDAELPKSYTRENDIATFDFVINWEIYKKDTDIFKLMRRNSTFPKTSQPSVTSLVKLYEENLKKFKDILIISVSSKFSGTHNACVQAKKTFSRMYRHRIHIIDSETSSGAEALLVQKCVDLKKQGKNIDEIVNLLPKFAQKLSLIGVFDDTKWLVAGGRISAIKGMVVKNMLKTGVRPILTIRDGEIVVKKIQINAKNKAEALFLEFSSEIKRDDKIDVVISHADCKREAEKLKRLLVKFSKSIKIKYVHEVSQVLGCHLGPDTLLLSWAA